MANMQSGTPDVGRTGRFRLFVASLWLTLATALICALVPASVPQAAIHGSAFSPANGVVALQASSTSVRAVHNRSEDSDLQKPGFPRGDVITPTDGLPLASASIEARLPHRPVLATLSIFPGRIAAYPRGPPRA